MFDNAFKFPHDPRGREQSVRDQAQALPREVIDRGEDAEAPPAHQRVHDEVE